jgi:hypothetical protein
VLQRSDGSVAFVLRDGARADRRNLQLGVIRDGYAEVVSGIAVGEQVIVRGSSRLVEGELIDLRDVDGNPIEVPNADGTPSVAGEPAPARSIP